MGINFLYIVLASLLVMAVSLIGVLVIWKKLGSWTERNIKYLVSFSAGVFLVVSFDLIEEAFKLSGAVFTAIISIIIGTFVICVGTRLFPESHHHHEVEDEKDTHTKNEAGRILIGDAIHNAADGILLAPAFIANTYLGIVATAGILIHELVQEVSEFFVLKEAGYSTKQALTRNLATSSTILLGATLGFFLSTGTSLAGPLLGVAAGGFLYIVLIDLIPKTFTSSRESGQYTKHALAILLGILLIIGLNQITVH